MPNDDLTALLQSGAQTGSIAVDVSTSAMQPPAQAEGRRREVEEALRAAGADDAMVGRLLGAVVQVPGAGDPIGVAAVAAGTTLVQQPTPGAVPNATQAGFGSVPDLTAVLRGRERAVPVLAVEARAAGGVIHVFPAAGLAESGSEEVTGEDVAVHEAHSSGISQSAHGHSADEALAQNARALADRTRGAVRTSGAATVVVLGDPRAAELLATELRHGGDLAVAVLGKDTAAAGADPADLTGAVLMTTTALLADVHRELVDRLSANSSRLGASGVEAVTTALQGAAVETLLVGPDGVPGELVALGAAPWVAATEADALGAEVLGQVPAAAALIRAAVLTDAAVRFPDAGVLPDGAPVAAHLRRPADDRTDDQEDPRG